MKHKLAIVIPYFGDWPAWINFFIESCRWNRGIDWFLFNDRAPPENRSRNVHHVRIRFDEYKSLVSRELELQFNPSDPYKLCDIKPALPYLHRHLVRGHEFVGYGDLDLVYGDIRSFYTDALLDQYDLFSSHNSRVSGHLCVMRNREDVVNAFRHVKGWKEAFCRPHYVDFDERAFYNLFAARRGNLLRPASTGSIRCFFREAYSTPAPAERMQWFWKGGQLTNEFYPQHPFMYLHFMSWHSNRWYKDQPGADPLAPAPWSVLPNLVQMDWRDARGEGFMISPQGIQSIERRP